MDPCLPLAPASVMTKPCMRQDQILLRSSLIASAIHVFAMSDLQRLVSHYSETASQQFQKVPGSAILLRYIRSSYQNDPIRSAIELFLFLFAVGYLLSPKYEIKDKNKIKLSEDVRVNPWWRKVCC